MEDDKAGVAFIGKTAWRKKTSDSSGSKVGNNKSQNSNVTSVKKEIRCYRWTL